MSDLTNREIEWLLREKYSGEKSPEFEKDVERLHQGEPVDYIIGHRPFLSCKIDLSLRPLIPRTETEFWVEQAIELIKAEHPQDTQVRVLDIFAGSGCIGIALMKHLPNVQVDFSEKDRVMCKQIGKNIEFNEIDSDRATIVRSDVFSKISGTYDYIFANPPYIDSQAPDTVQESVLKWEPHSALFAKNAGLDFIETLIEDSEKHLNPGGTLFVECSPEQQSLLSGYLRAQDINHEFWKDQHGHWRVIKITW